MLEQVRLTVFREGDGWGATALLTWNGGSVDSNEAFAAAVEQLRTQGYLVAVRTGGYQIDGRWPSAEQALSFAQHVLAHVERRVREHDGGT